MVSNTHPANVGTSSNFLYGVAAISTNDVWAVGFCGGYQTLVEHWDGSSWLLCPVLIPEISMTRSLQ